MNVNSIRNKSESLMEIKDVNVDVLCIAKINVDFSFPNAQFYRISFILSHRCKQQKL